MLGRNGSKKKESELMYYRIMGKFGEYIIFGE